MHVASVCVRPCTFYRQNFTLIEHRLPLGTGFWNFARKILELNVKKCKGVLVPACNFIFCYILVGHPNGHICYTYTLYMYLYINIYYIVVIAEIPLESPKASATMSWRHNFKHKRNWWKFSLLRLCNISNKIFTLLYSTYIGSMLCLCFVLITPYWSNESAMLV